MTPIVQYATLEADNNFLCAEDQAALILVNRGTYSLRELFFRRVGTYYLSVDRTDAEKRIFYNTIFARTEVVEFEEFINRNIKKICLHCASDKMRTQMLLGAFQELSDCRAKSGNASHRRLMDKLCQVMPNPRDYMRLPMPGSGIPYGTHHFDESEYMIEWGKNWNQQKSQVRAASSQVGKDFKYTIYMKASMAVLLTAVLALAFFRTRST